ncbi:TetR/AcrR family transcriptional regulator [Amycolatopsis anabasis]|uniref:TetR/AcrR family transcriptional regulator n=1 Tax=Amycolatopsis anabasis TaxID=1840409 RepID=UPI00131B52BE|nr:TetR/AcrR family transcriptional regulator [Amycolatopsis anabasis]
MRDEKAARILDAAEALLVRFGYRRTTVDDVAREARIGKGTVYLYWPSKLELFGSVLTRQSAHMLDEQLARVRADPAEVRLHRSMRCTFRQIVRRPLSKAFATRDYAVLGDLLTGSQSGTRFLTGKLETTARYVAVLHRHGLADDPAADPSLLYRLSTSVTGAFLLEGAPGMGDLSLEDKADALATTPRRASEPAARPTLRCVDAVSALSPTLVDELPPGSAPRGSKLSGHLARLIPTMRNLSLYARYEFDAGPA